MCLVIGHALLPILHAVLATLKAPCMPRMHLCVVKDTIIVILLDFTL